MQDIISLRRFKRAEFKSGQQSSIQQNGFILNEHRRIIIRNRNCRTLSSPSNYLLIFFLLFSCCTTCVHSNAVDDLYRSRSKRQATTVETSIIRPDTVCNQGGLHECVCNRSMGNLDDSLLICDRLLEEKKLTAVSLVVRNINLDVKLHTNELYQQYFRRRIANIVSHYCEHQANECPGAILSLNRNNVIILRVNYLSRQRTEILIVVSKESMPKKLSESTLIDSKKVKNILGAQLAPLSRILGGVQIEKLRLVDIDRRKATGQNSKLFNLIVVVAISVGICYVIACTKICRDSLEKRRAKKNSAMLVENNNRNYGTCTDKLLSSRFDRLSSCEAPNGKVKSKSAKNRDSGGYASKDRRTSGGDRRSTASKRNNNDDPTSITIDINRQDISQPETSPTSGATDRSFQRMFACDLSQLPAESSDLIDDDPNSVFLDESEPHISPKNGNGLNYIESAEVHNVSAENTPNTGASNRRPSVVPIVVASGSPQSNVDNELQPAEENPSIEITTTKPEYTHQDSIDSIGINQYFQTTKSSLLSAMSEPGPYARPLSRRGSRDSTPEQGEEFADNESVDSLQPLGDTESPHHGQLAQKNPEITFDQLSSDNEDEEPNELYHKLNEEEEEVKEEPPTEQDVNYANSDSDDELLNESRMLERHAYERLEESPLPSPSKNNNNNSIDSTILVKTKSLEEAANDLAEEIPDEDLR